MFHTCELRAMQIEIRDIGYEYGCILAYIKPYSAFLLLSVARRDLFSLAIGLNKPNLPT